MATKTMQQHINAAASTTAPARAPKASAGPVTGGATEVTPKRQKLLAGFVDGLSQVERDAVRNLLDEADDRASAAEQGETETAEEGRRPAWQEQRSPRRSY